MPVNSMAPNAKFDFFGKKSSRDHSKCPHCGKEHSKYRGKTLAYFHAPIAVVSGYCHDCEGFTVCLLGDDHRVVETYFDLTWELREWPLYYAPF